MEVGGRGGASQGLPSPPYSSVSAWAALWPQACGGLVSIPGPSRPGPPALLCLEAREADARLIPRVRPCPCSPPWVQQAPDLVCCGWHHHGKGVLISYLQTELIGWTWGLRGLAECWSPTLGLGRKPSVHPAAPVIKMLLLPPAWLPSDLTCPPGDAQDWQSACFA